jgi:ribosomal protein L11 methyltransferase
VGCGSGILSIAALKLGASQALAVDIDRQAIRSTRENATNNAIAQGLESGLGSVPDILQGSFTLRQAPLVLANILAPVIIRLLDGGLAELIQPGGVIILSGILDRQVEDVLAAARGHGLVEIERGQILDWVALALRK